MADTEGDNNEMDKDKEYNVDKQGGQGGQEQGHLSKFKPH